MRYIISLNVIVEADNLRDAIAVARDHARVSEKRITVIGTFVLDERGLPQVVQWGEDE